MWSDDIEVELRIKNLRIGKGIAAYDVDLPTLPMKYASSSVKGILRKAAKKVVNSVDPNLKNAETVVFGSEKEEGKIQILTKPNNSKADRRYGIKIDPRFGSVKRGHLFCYEYLPVETLSFSIKPLLPLSDGEALLVYCSLNFLRYESLGGYGSRGFGLIEEVRISEEFEKYVKERLE